MIDVNSSCGRPSQRCWPAVGLNGGKTQREFVARLPFVSLNQCQTCCVPQWVIFWTKLLRRAVFSVCRYSPERKLTGGGPWLQTSETCFTGRVFSHCFFLLQAVNSVLKRLWCIFSPFFFPNHFPLLFHVVVAFFIVPVKTLTFLLSSILRGAPIKPFRWSDPVRMLPERRAAPAGKWSESPSVSVRCADRVAYLQRISALL